MITANHVVDGCNVVTVIMIDGSQVEAKVIASDSDLDIALLKPLSFVVPTYYLEIANDDDSLSVGSQITTWGFPGGYNGATPLLGVGYLSGSDAIKLPSNRIITRWVVNAAFNHGNSGGPMVDVKSGKVIGIVNSKLTQLSPKLKAIIDYLQKHTDGISYVGTLPNGKEFIYSEGTLVGGVLDDLQEQVQLVVGYATLTRDLRDFLKKNGIAP